MDALTLGASSGLVDLLAFNAATAVRRQHQIDGEIWTFNDAAVRLGWINSGFQSERTSFSIGGRAVQAATTLRKGIRWTHRYPIPRQVRGRRGKRRVNRAYRAFAHAWWKIAAVDGGAGFWLHAVLPSELCQVIRLLAEKGIIGVDTGDRRSGRSRAALFTAWTARIAELRALGIAVSTTPSSDRSRNNHRIHTEVRFDPPGEDARVVDLGEILTTGNALARSQVQLGETMDVRAMAARAKAARDAEQFRREWAALSVST